MTATVPAAQSGRSPRAAAPVLGAPAGVRSHQGVPGRHRRRAVLAVALACAGVAVLAVIAADGAAAGLEPAATDGLPDAGASVAGVAPVLRLATTVTGVLVVGLLLTRTVLTPGIRSGVAGVRVLGASWAAAAGALAVLSVHEIAAIPLGGLRPGEVLATAWTLGPTRTWLVSGALAVGVLALAGAGRAGIVALGLALVALVVPVYSGHAATMPDHAGTTGALVVHVLAAALWVGGLAGLVLLVRPGSPVLPVAARRFSPVALGCVVALGLSGAVAAVAALGPPGSAWSSPYAGLLLAKAALLVVLVACGAAHRRRTLPQLAQGGAGPFVRLVVVELLVMAAAAGVATALARTPQAGAGDVLPVLPAVLGWRPDPLLLAAVVVTVLAGVAALRSGGVRPPRARAGEPSSFPARAQHLVVAVVVVHVGVLAAGLPSAVAVPRTVLLAVVLPVLLAVALVRIGPAVGLAVAPPGRTGPTAAPADGPWVPGAVTTCAVLVLAVLAAARPPGLLEGLPPPAHLLVPGLGLLAGILLGTRQLARGRPLSARVADLEALATLTGVLGVAALVPRLAGHLSGGDGLGIVLGGAAARDGTALLGGALIAALAARSLRRVPRDRWSMTMVRPCDDDPREMG
nr:CopD family protein [uncultured Actinotalea sp.]